jgi:hypothetical protein
MWGNMVEDKWVPSLSKEIFFLHQIIGGELKLTGISDNRYIGLALAITSTMAIGKLSIRPGLLLRNC